MNLNSKTIVLNSIGKIILQKKVIAKYLGIRIKPFEGVFVTVPKRVSYKEAEEFVRSKETWILKHLSRIEKKGINKVIFSETSKLETKAHKILIIKSNINKSRIIIDNGITKIEYPENEDIYSDEIQEFIKFGIDETLRIEAKNYIPQRVKELASLHKFNYNKVFLKNIKSRWGSCSSRNNINLNIHLMKLPYKLIDYVILHELVHTVHKNHSKRFWNALEKILNNSKKMDKSLRQYSPQKYQFED